jgi:hypothetical protein
VGWKGGGGVGSHFPKVVEYIKLTKS